MDSAERRRSETDIGGGPRNSADARPSLDLSSDPMLESNLALRKLSEAFGKSSKLFSSIEKNTSPLYPSNLYSDVSCGSQASGV